MRTPPLPAPRPARRFLGHLALFAMLAAITTASPARADGPVDKLGRGLAGMIAGVLELPGNTWQETNRRGAIGVPIGLGKGIAMVIARELVGVYEFVTSPLPVPAGYRPILEPEYPWDYFDQRSERD